MNCDANGGMDCFLFRGVQLIVPENGTEVRRHHTGKPQRRMRGANLSGGLR